MNGFDAEILQDFLTESGELLERVEGDLVDLESRADDADLINQIFRALHTIKGSASFLDLANLVEIAHVSESALNAARGGQIRVDQRMMDLLLKAVDVIKVQFDEVQAGAAALTAADAGLVSALAAIGEGGTPADDKVDEADAGGASDPQTAVATAAEPDTGASAGADEIGESPLTLGGAQNDLFEPFVKDLADQRATLIELVQRLGSEGGDPAAANELEEVCRDLLSTIEFFELEPLAEVVRAVRVGGVAIGPGGDEAVGQILPRLEALLGVLGRQHEALARKAVLRENTAAMIERVLAVAGGETLAPGAALAPGVDAETAARVDGLDPDGGDEAATVATAASAPAQTADEPAPAEAAAPEPASPEPTAAPAQAPVSPSPPTQPQAPQSQPAAAQAQAGAVEQTIRVEVGRLESLMNLVGELVLQKNRIGELSDRLMRNDHIDHEFLEQVELTTGSLSRVTSDIQVAVMRTRMQPLDKLFGKYPRLIRDLAQRTGKKIKLQVVGGDTEVDKSVIEELGDPLVHLMRNSADHGLESPEERAASGKDETGTIFLEASQRGNHVCIMIRDNGRGIPRDKIGAKAVERGLVRAGELESMTDEQVLGFIFQPGFSTAEQATDLSGRGVGMDVVRTNIERLDGTIDLRSTVGEGTEITITIPLTVAIMPAMMVAIGDEQYAVPLGSIVEIVKPDADQLGSIVTERVLRIRDRVLPLARGREVLGLEEGEGDELALILEASGKRIAMLVSRVIGQQEIVIKPLEGSRRAGAVSGATVRNDGGVSLIIDVAALIRRAR